MRSLLQNLVEPFEDEKEGTLSPVSRCVNKIKK
jgi:hypothetical protein